MCKAHSKLDLAYDRFRVAHFRQAESPELGGCWRGFPSEVTMTQAQWIVFGYQPLRKLHQGAPFPNGDQIPFSSFMEIPLPFATSSIRDFALCHLPAMTSPDFLIGDEWMGYYSCFLSLAHIDPPMRGIIFERDHTQPASIPYIMPLSATGMDFVGTFTLRGQINCRSGKFDFIKQYINGPKWYWLGIMTPFGMVARWSTGVFTIIRGWVWLWKAKWTHSSPQKKVP